MNKKTMKGMATLIMAVILVGGYVAPVQAQEAKSIEVTGITGHSGLVYAVLMSDVKKGSDSIAALGAAEVSNNMLVVQLLDYKNTQNQWTGSGDYEIMLSFKQDGADDIDYLYTGGGNTLAKLNFSSPKVTIAMDQFSISSKVKSPGVSGNSGMDYSTMRIFLILGALAIPLIASIGLKITVARFSKIKTSSGLTGAQVAAKLLEVNNIRNIGITSINGSLTDYYMPGKHIALSQPVYGAATITAVGVAAHEVGHAIQYKPDSGYKMIKIRAPIRQIQSKAAMFTPLVTMGAILIPQIPYLLDFAILLVALAVFVSLLTLPIEFNASSRALKALKANNLLTTKAEIRGAKKVLRAAAFTYVAATLALMMDLIRLLLLRKQRKGKRR